MDEKWLRLLLLLYRLHVDYTNNPILERPDAHVHRWIPKSASVDVPRRGSVLDAIFH